MPSKRGNSWCGLWQARPLIILVCVVCVLGFAILRNDALVVATMRASIEKVRTVEDSARSAKPPRSKRRRAYIPPVAVLVAGGLRTLERRLPQLLTQIGLNVTDESSFDLFCDVAPSSAMNTWQMIAKSTKSGAKDDFFVDLEAWRKSDVSALASLRAMPQLRGLRYDERGHEEIGRDEPRRFLPSWLAGGVISNCPTGGRSKNCTELDPEYSAPLQFTVRLVNAVRYKFAWELMEADVGPEHTYATVVIVRPDLWLSHNLRIVDFNTTATVDEPGLLFDSRAVRQYLVSTAGVPRGALARYAPTRVNETTLSPNGLLEKLYLLRGGHWLEGFDPKFMFGSHGAMRLVARSIEYAEEVYGPVERIILENTESFARFGLFSALRDKGGSVLVTSIDNVACIRENVCTRDPLLSWG